MYFKAKKVKLEVLLVILYISAVITPLFGPPFKERQKGFLLQFYWDWFYSYLYILSKYLTIFFLDVECKKKIFRYPK